MKSTVKKLSMFTSLLLLLAISIALIGLTVYINSTRNRMVVSDVRIVFAQSDSSAVSVKVGDRISLSVDGKENSDLTIQRRIEDQWVTIENGTIKVPTTYDGFEEGQVFKRWTTNSDATSSVWPILISEEDKDGITIYAVWEI
ncbi:MAG: hypothetical protein LBU60_05915 [Clostridiales bacterium]|jgi:uncharacterized repeat protein (TIGR02543 family)|nr:hypothetical protein [Clostridiales bacterium]